MAAVLYTTFLAGILPDTNRGGERSGFSLCGDRVGIERLQSEYTRPGHGTTPVLLVARPAVPLESMWGELKDFR